MGGLDGGGYGGTGAPPSAIKAGCELTERLRVGGIGGGGGGGYGGTGAPPSAKHIFVEIPAHRGSGLCSRLEIINGVTKVIDTSAARLRLLILWKFIVLSSKLESGR